MASAGPQRYPARSGKPVAAIFIHAGAGYHSTHNEKVHLEACSRAARLAMRALKSGADATAAVEIAIRCLEDMEITNAGYGSNLTIEGVVEADATIVDHLGRSGACGAVPGIKNPISLAKIILETSSQKLSLRRVPPNILVGTGAQEFARDHGMNPVANIELVSKNAQERFDRWFEDLQRAEARANSRTSLPCHYPNEEKATSASVLDEAAASSAITTTLRRDHQAALLLATWNEGQPDSPYHSSPPSEPASGQATPKLAPTQSARNPLNFMPALQATRSKRPRPQSRHTDDLGGLSSSSSPAAKRAKNADASPHDSPVGDDPPAETESEQAPLPSMHPDLDPAPTADINEVDSTESLIKQHRDEDRDMICDTVGAIAIDLQGRIAAGSSSGGIGMKHRGRIGPAALVGVGTAVIPSDAGDPDEIAVAAVTSGTGEHMATTMASHKCAERLYHCTRRGADGRDVEEYDEGAIMTSFIDVDFMGHPGVRHQPSAGAIGVMAVKKTKSGYYLFFAHNTDSFALASMASTDREPMCTMSRVVEANTVRGGRRIHPV